MWRHATQRKDGQPVRLGAKMRQEFRDPVRFMLGAFDDLLRRQIAGVLGKITDADRAFMWQVYPGAFSRCMNLPQAIAYRTRGSLAIPRRYREPLRSRQPSRHTGQSARWGQRCVCCRLQRTRSPRSKHSSLAGNYNESLTKCQGKCYDYCLTGQCLRCAFAAEIAPSSMAYPTWLKSNPQSGQINFHHSSVRYASSRNTPRGRSLMALSNARISASGSMPCDLS